MQTNIETIAMACHISTNQAAAVLTAAKTSVEKQRVLLGLDILPGTKDKRDEVTVTVGDHSISAQQ